MPKIIAIDLMTVSFSPRQAERFNKAVDERNMLQKGQQDA